MSVAAAIAPLTIRWRAPEPAVKQLPSAKVLPLLRAAIATAPDRIDLKVQLAKALFRTEQMQEIVDQLGPAIENDDAAPEILYYLGRACLRIRDDQLACLALRSAAAKGFA